MKTLLKKYKNNKFFSAAYNEAFGFHNGKFYTALCNAISYADKDNSAILQKAYPELYEMICFFNNSSRTDVDNCLEEIKEEEKSENK